MLSPFFLPRTPFRSFALKGAVWGLISTLFLSLAFSAPALEKVSVGFINLSIASFLSMNFTGSSTYTSLSGVKKEMKWAIPFQITFVVTGIVLFVLNKLFQ